MPERAFDSKRLSHQFRVSESDYIGKNFLNEIRFQFTDENLETTPVSDETATIVLDAFSSGGAGNRNKSRRQSVWLADNLLFGCCLTVPLQILIKDIACMLPFFGESEKA